VNRIGRKPLGPQLVEHLEGSTRAKHRLRVILETVTGNRTIPDACEELGIGESMFYKLRTEVLQTALARLEPRPLGRPTIAVTEGSQQAAALEAEVEELREELQASQVREELAQIMPHLVRTPHVPRKKTTKSLRPKDKPRRGRLRNLEWGKTKTISTGCTAPGKSP
jgi:hypothetical protein